MSFRPRSNLLAALAAGLTRAGMVPSAQIKAGIEGPNPYSYRHRSRVYIVSTHHKDDSALRKKHRSTAKSSKRRRNRVKIRNHK